jgi:hypothetical protein
MITQYDMFDETDEEKRLTEIQQKLEYLATGKAMRGLKGKDAWEAHEKKCRELFGEK